ncbi:MAG: YciI family protein [Marinobacter sp.]|nr:YciI family protein [Marinobacter sp.]
MYFVVFGTDKPGMEKVRASVRSEHREHLRHHDHSVKVVLGGPTLAEDQETMNGTMLVIEGSHIQQVRAFLEQDPYNKAGLFKSLEVRPWQWGLGAPGNDV